MPSDAPRDGVIPLDATVFLAELALLAGLAVAGARLGGSTVFAVLQAVGLPLVVAGIWGALLAPNSTRRLGYPIRLVLKVDLFTAAAVLLGISGLLTWAVVFWVVAVVLVVAAEVSENRRASAG